MPGGGGDLRGHRPEPSQAEAEQPWTVWNAVVRAFGERVRKDCRALELIVLQEHRGSHARASADGRIRPGCRPPRTSITTGPVDRPARRSIPRSGDFEDQDQERRHDHHETELGPPPDRNGSRPCALAIQWREIENQRGLANSLRGWMTGSPGSWLHASNA